MWILELKRSLWTRSIGAKNRIFRRDDVKKMSSITSSEQKNSDFDRALSSLAASSYMFCKNF